MVQNTDTTEGEIYVRLGASQPPLLEDDFCSISPEQCGELVDAQRLRLVGPPVFPDTWPQEPVFLNGLFPLYLMPREHQIQWSLYLLNNGVPADRTIAHCRDVCRQAGFFLKLEKGEWNAYPLPDLRLHDIVQGSDGSEGQIRRVEAGRAFVRWQQGKRYSCGWIGLDAIRLVRRPSTADVSDEVGRLESRITDLDVEINEIGQCREGCIVADTSKGPRTYYRYQYRVGGRRKSNAIPRQEVGRYRQEIENHRRKEKLTAKKQQLQDSLDLLRASQAGNFTGHFVPTREIGTWRVQDSRTRRTDTKRVTFTCSFETKDERGRSHRSRVLKELKFSAPAHSPDRIAMAEERARAMAILLNEESPGQNPGPELLSQLLAQTTESIAMTPSEARRD